MKHIFEYVEWVDSRRGNPSWQITSDDFDDVCVVKSVGLVVRETETTLFLAMSIADEDEDSPQVAGVFAIPKVCIRDRLVILEEIGER